MLIVAMPKSASTSLMDTMGKLHNVTAIQTQCGSNPIPQNCRYLHTQHGDVRELTVKNAITFKNENIIYKQHIYPTENNLALTAGIKKVVLLRDVREVILAYRRGARQKAHKFHFQHELSLKMTEDEWIEKSKQIGFWSDIEFFYKAWNSQGKDENVLLLSYTDLVDNTKATINSIEEHFGLQLTTGQFTLSKSRYSRRNKYVNRFFMGYRNFHSKSRAYAAAISTKLGLKDIILRLIKSR